MPGYLQMEELISMIDETRRALYCQILADHSPLFRQAAGSSHNHQAWPGGYWDHVTEVMNLAVILFKTLNNARALQFSLSAALEVLFLHDIEKPWRGYLDAEGKFVLNPDLAGKAARKEFRDRKLEEYGIQLNTRQLNALRYVEGELDDYSPGRCTQWPLGAFCHMCDNTSARLWPTFPLPGNDPWKGAGRTTDTSEYMREYYSLYLNSPCPDCGSLDQEVRNYDAMWHDGDVHCRNCGARVRSFDAG
ncbi:MAG TPA: hypothetical protein VLE72_00220 [Candidatus Saccharimonadales bacterium]|nr:hypothetical protein [Candidatus Saccharimonadales bacterium]